MNKIKPLEEGIADLLERFSPEDVIIVEIPCRSFPTYADTLHSWFQINGLYVPQERRILATLNTEDPNEYINNPQLHENILTSVAKHYKT